MRCLPLAEAYSPYGVTFTLSGAAFTACTVSVKACGWPLQTAQLKTEFAGFSGQQGKAVVVKEFHSVLIRFQAEPGRGHLPGIGQGEP